MNSFWKPHSSFWFRNHSLQITAYSSCWNKHHCMVQCMQQVSFCGGKQDDTLRRSQPWQLEAWPAYSQWSEGLRSEFNYAVGKSVCLQEFRKSYIDGAYDFSQFFIDERYQGNGFGYEAAGHVLREMQKDGVYNRAVLCYIEGNEAAKQLYLKLGFNHTGETDGNEIIMEKKLR